MLSHPIESSDGKPLGAPGLAMAPTEGIMLYIGQNPAHICGAMIDLGLTGLCFRSVGKAVRWLAARKNSALPLPLAILADASLKLGLLRKLGLALRRSKAMRNIPFILLADTLDATAKQVARTALADDVYEPRPNNTQHIVSRIHRLVKIKRLVATRQEGPTPLQPHMLQPAKVRLQLFAKRAIDVLVAGAALLLLSPLMALVALLIKLDSPGPVFYISKRAGRNYKIFDFYKFRTMRPDADQLLQAMGHLNQYKQAEGPGQPVFVKLGNDPRVTRLGRFLRNTSIDELPQLLNILKGDMSLVGNRPLPLYEAKTLTRDRWAGRFLAPAGLTGLWQVTKRGKADMSAEERVMLDVQYAHKHNLRTDFELIFRTIPALIQKENV